MVDRLSSPLLFLSASLTHSFYLPIRSKTNPSHFQCCSVNCNDSKRFVLLFSFPTKCIRLVSMKWKKCIDPWKCEVIHIKTMAIFHMNSVNLNKIHSIEPNLSLSFSLSLSHFVCLRAENKTNTAKETRSDEKRTNSCFVEKNNETKTHAPEVRWCPDRDEWDTNRKNVK